MRAQPRRTAAVVSLAFLFLQPLDAQPAGLREPTLDAVVQRLASYVERYGPEASVIVASEKYSQTVVANGRQLRPVFLESEFAIVEAAGETGWIGYRDVVEVNGRAVADRRDRLVTLLTTPGGDAELARILEESARFNVGPVARNFNLPTTALYFFHPRTIGRFAFTRKGTKTVGGVRVWVLTFEERQRPTLVGRRDGTDVPCSGEVWVVPDDGAVVRTRLRLRGFADHTSMTGGEGWASERIKVNPAPPPPPSPAPAPPPAPPPSTPSPQPSPQPAPGSTGGTVTTTAPQPDTTPPYQGRPQWEDEGGSLQRMESFADIDVTFTRDAAMGVWLPLRMTETYEGPIPRGTRTPIVGRATATAEYSTYRRFETSGRVVP